MVRPVGRIGIEAGVVSAEGPLGGQAGRPEELEGPVHGDQADAGVLSADLVVQLLGADVAAGGEEGAHDRLALARALEAGAAQGDFTFKM